MKLAPSAQKIRGAYYTPPFLADFLAGWAIRDRHDCVLEPSCGDGEVLVSAGMALDRLGADRHAMRDQLLGYEVEAREAAQARTRLARGQLSATIFGDDFFSAAAALVGKRRFHAVVGNPPYIRYQNFPEAHREPAFALMRAAGLKPTRLTNAWVPFVVTSTMLLEASGRLAMVLPAELLQVGYAGELRRYLSDSFHRITLFTFRKLVFDGIQQEVLLLCGERSAEGPAGIQVVEIDDPAELSHLRRSGPSETKILDHATEKWTRYFLTRSELSLIRRLEEDERIPRLGAVAEVDVGVVTGLNDFFVLSGQRAKEIGAAKHARPIITKSAQLAGARISQKEFDALDAADAPVHLLDLRDAPPARLPSGLQRYIRAAEAKGWHEGYKCRIRDPWWRLPSIWTPDAFLLRQIHRYPKLVLNGASATSTDTIHRVRFRSKQQGPAIAAGILCSLSFAFAELVGRSYGGGVLELEPTEAEKLPVPLVGADALSLRELDRLVRANDIGPLLVKTDAILLEGGLGLSRAQVASLRGIWAKLRDRRHGRKQRSVLPTRQDALRFGVATVP